MAQWSGDARSSALQRVDWARVRAGYLHIECRQGVDLPRPPSQAPFRRPARASTPQHQHIRIATNLPAHRCVGNVEHRTLASQLPARTSSPPSAIDRAIACSQLISFLVSMGGSLWLVYKIMQQMDPTTATRKQIRVAQNQIRRRLRKKVDLTNAEMVSMTIAGMMPEVMLQSCSHICAASGCGELTYCFIMQP